MSERLNVNGAEQVTGRRHHTVRWVVVALVVVAVGVGAYGAGRAVHAANLSTCRQAVSSMTSARDDYVGSLKPADKLVRDAGGKGMVSDKGLVDRVKADGTSVPKAPVLSCDAQLHDDELDAHATTAKAKAASYVTSMKSVQAHQVRLRHDMDASSLKKLKADVASAQQLYDATADGKVADENTRVALKQQIDKSNALIAQADGKAKDAKPQDK